MSDTSSHTRPLIVGGEAGPSAPFPLRLSGPVIEGFGRGSKELGIPTANIPIEGLSIAGHEDLESGIYFGFASLPSQVANGNHASSSTNKNSSTRTVYPMVMSIGWNPYYKNKVRSVEVHIMHSFAADFYSAPLRLLILAYIRPERDYSSMQALTDDINTDIVVTRKSLDRVTWQSFAEDAWLNGKIE